MFTRTPSTRTCGPESSSGPQACWFISHDDGCSGRPADPGSACLLVLVSEGGLGTFAWRVWTSARGSADDDGEVVADPGGAMFGIRAGRAFDGERVVPGGALVLVDDGRIAG